MMSARLTGSIIEKEKKMSADIVFEVRFEHGSETTKARIVKWKVKIGSRITHGSVLALYDDDPVEDVQKNSDKLKRIKANMVGTVRELLVSEGDTLHKGCALLMVQGCSHPVVMKNMCAECGADLLEVKQELKRSTASVAMVHSIPELIVSNEQAEILGRADEERLIKSRKLVLLVDLDQTLVHTTNDDVPDKLKDVHHFQFCGSHSKWYHVRIRPGTQEFLKAVSKLYELHICTFGARYYAHIIAKFLDKDGRYFSHRILSRDECVSARSKMPNLKALFPCGDQMVCIIDDREDVWNFLPNVVQVKPYHFFQHTGDINAPPGLTKTEGDKDGKYVVGARKTENKDDSDNDGPEPNPNISVVVQQEDKADNLAHQAFLETPPQQMSLESPHPFESLETSLEKPPHQESIETSVDQTSLEVLLPLQESSLETSSQQESLEPPIQQTTLDNSSPQQSLEPSIQQTTLEPLIQQTILENSSPQTLLETPLQETSLEGSPPQQLSLETPVEQPSLKSGHIAEIAQENKLSRPNEIKTLEEDNKQSGSDGASVFRITEEPQLTLDSNDAKPDIVVAKKNDELLADAEKKQEFVCVTEISTKDDEVKGNLEVIADNDEVVATTDPVDVHDDDDYLLYLTDILTKIHTEFYKKYDHMQVVGAPGIPNLRDIVPLTKRAVLRGVRIVFSGVIPTNVAVEKSHVYQVARSLGAEIHPRLIKAAKVQDKETEENKKRGGRQPAAGTTHVVAARLGTVKVSEARRISGIHIVTPEWLWCCASRWDHVDERIFPLTKESEQSREKKALKDCDEALASEDQHAAPTAKVVLPSGELNTVAFPTYDSVTGKRINKTGQQKGNNMAYKPCYSDEASAQETGSSNRIVFKKVEGLGDDGSERRIDRPSGSIRPSVIGPSGETQSFVQSINPLMSFGSEDIASMDQEVEDFLDDGADNESTSNDEDYEERTKLLVLRPKRTDDRYSSSSSSEDSLSGACPKGWAKKRKRSSQESGECSMDVNTSGGSQEKYLRGEIPVDSDRSASSSSQEDNESGDSVGSVDDEMADAVERQLLEL